jgi:membrane protease YdiL (CAAX protease family)
MIPTLIDQLLVVILGLVLPFISGIRGSEQMHKVHFDEGTRRRFFLLNSLVLWLLAVVVMGIWYWNERPWSLMGFQKIVNQPMTWVATAAFVVFYGLEVIQNYLQKDQQQKTFEQWEHNIPFLPESYREILAYTLLCLSAAICEEIMYRGFMVNYFINPMKDGFPWIAVVFPAVMFSIAHFYQGYEAMGKIFILSALFGVIFIVSKSLLIVVILHFLIDLFGGVMAVFFRKKP